MTTLPKSLVLAKGWKKGDLLEFILNSRGEIVVKKVIENKKEIIIGGEDDED
ncbi:hypothetical protein ACFL1H_02250 [Nanoarchaeota archaeon]